jgi:magnesium-transporting ATPase (P-type)
LFCAYADCAVAGSGTVDVDQYKSNTNKILMQIWQSFPVNNWQRIQMDQEKFPWHNYTVESALKDLQSSTDGLDQHEAEVRLARFGGNRLPEAAKRGALLRFVSHFHHLLIYVLIGAALMTAVLGHWIDTGVIFAVVLANALIGFIQEGKAEKALDAIRHMLALHANVIRGGQRIRIEGQKLVPGDIVLLEAGDKVPADLRLLSAHGLSVQEAILTGESVPVEKGIDAVAKNAALGDRNNMAFSGTLVARG